MIGRNKHLDIVIDAILSARQLTSKGKMVKVYITEKNKLINSFEPDELKDIFEKLERDEKIFKINHTPSIFCGYYGVTESVPRYEIAVKDNFDKWVTDYWNSKERNLKPVPNEQSETSYSQVRSIPLVGTIRLSKRSKIYTTNTLFTVKKIIWQHAARGESPSQILQFFQLHADQKKYKKVPLSLHTINKDIEDITRVPEEVMASLIVEIPELKSLLNQKMK
jgi:hypothetical protein